MRGLCAAVAFIASLHGAAYANGFDPARRTVFADPTVLLHQCSRRTPGPIQGTWRLTDDDVRAVEEKLEPYLGAQLSLNNWGEMEPFKIEQYYRQYGGLIIGGRLIIYVNAFHERVLEHRPKERQEQWRTIPAAICDGRELAFGVEYDVEKQAFSNFHFNGGI